MMTGPFTIFRKALAAIIVLLVPILFLYSYSYKVSVEVVKNQIQSSSLNQLSFFLSQFDSNVEQLSLFPVILSSDPYVRAFVEQGGGGGFETIKEQSKVFEKMSLQSVSSPWTNELTVFLPKERKVVSSNIFKTYDQAYVAGHVPVTQWAYEDISVGSAVVGHFARQVTSPLKSVSLEQTQALFQVAFPVDNITRMLDKVKAGGEGDPFFYKPGYEPIVSSNPDRHKIGLLMGAISSDSPDDTDQTIGHRVIRIEDRDYSVNYVRSAQLGWYLVDYLPVETILRPITASGNLFYVTFGLLLIMGLAAALLLYRYVRNPIQRLMHGVQRMHKGDLSVRLESRGNNEFDFLFQRFNRMAEQIQELVEDVYEEKIRAREATLKQLQAQINPHFLYNSLFFIINTAKMGDQESVVKMAQSLAEYYRYTTRLEEQNVPLREELRLVQHYLNIQNLRMQRLYYEINVPDDMMDLKIPRLMLQPIVENAIVHGIEHQPGECIILIGGTAENGKYRLVVEDNGAGMTEEEMNKLRRKLALPMDRHMGTGVWNVHQRLQYAYGADAGLILESSPLGGMRVTLVWGEEERSGWGDSEGGDTDGEIVDRG